MGQKNAYTVLQFDIPRLEERPLTIKLAGHFQKDNDHFLSTRTIDEYVVLYCEDGSGWVELDGIRSTVTKGDIIFLPPNKPHGYGNNEGGSWSLIWFHFTGIYGEYFYTQTNTAGTNGIIAASQSTARESFEAAISLIEFTKSPSDVLNAEAILISAFCRLCENTRQTLPKNSPQAAYAQKAISILEKNVGDFISLEALAAQVGISKFYLIRLFKEQTGFTPKEYANTLNLKKACKLLKETNLSILEISQTLGFCNQYHFSKNFKLFSGYSPTKFRKFI